MGPHDLVNETVSFQQKFVDERYPLLLQFSTNKTEEKSNYLYYFGDSTIFICCVYKSQTDSKTRMPLKNKVSSLSTTS